MTHFDHAAINAAANDYFAGIREDREKREQERKRTQKILTISGAAIVALSYVAAFCDGIVDANKR